MKEDDKYIYYSDSRIFSKRFNRFLKPYLANHGYYMVNINNKLQLLHRAIAKIFLVKTDENIVVNHKNGIKTDNRVENLEWTTSSKNQLHAYNNGLKIPAQLGKSGVKHHRSKPVYSIHGTCILEHESKSLCAKYFNGSQGNINTAIRKGYLYKGVQLFQ